MGGPHASLNPTTAVISTAPGSPGQLTASPCSSYFVISSVFENLIMDTLYTLEFVVKGQLSEYIDHTNVIDHLCDF